MSHCLTVNSSTDKKWIRRPGDDVASPASFNISLFGLWIANVSSMLKHDRKHSNVSFDGRFEGISKISIICFRKGSDPNICLEKKKKISSCNRHESSLTQIPPELCENLHPRCEASELRIHTNKTLSHLGKHCGNDFLNHYRRRTSRRIRVYPLYSPQVSQERSKYSHRVQVPDGGGKTKSSLKQSERRVDINISDCRQTRRRGPTGVKASGPGVKDLPSSLFAPVNYLCVTLITCHPANMEPASLKHEWAQRSDAGVQERGAVCRLQICSRWVCDGFPPRMSLPHHRC